MAMMGTCTSKESSFDANFKKVKLPWWQNAPRKSYRQNVLTN
jgi:hypothetical protein